MNNIGLVLITGGSSVSSSLNVDLAPYVTVAKANPIYVNQIGNSMSSILDMKDNKIINVPNPIKSTDVANRNYVDTMLKPFTIDGTKIVYGTVDKDRLPPVMNYFSVPRITDLHEPVHKFDATNREYVDTKARGIINKNRISNVLNDFSVSRITGLQDPVNRTDAANKEHVDRGIIPKD